MTEFADKITKLLAKAESTTPEEAELLVAKAQELMTKYAITEAMLDEVRGTSTDEIGQSELIYVGIFQRSTMMLGFAIAAANNCRCVYLNGDGLTPVVIDLKKYKQWHRITVTGYDSDRARVELLNSSLQLQCARAMQTWWKAEDRSWWPKSDQFKERSSFIMGFANAVTQKLHAASRAGAEAAAAEAAVRDSTTEAVASDSVALVLRSRKDKVNDWYDKKYGKLRSSGGGRGRSVSRGAYGEGNAAGSRADVGQPRVGGQGALGR